MGDPRLCGLVRWRRAMPREQEVDQRRDDERENHGDGEAADDSDGQRLQHLRAGAESEGQRQHPADGGQSGHDDGAQAALRRVQHGLACRSSLGAKALVGVEQQNAIFGHDADHHDEPHERRDVERGAGDKEGQNDAGDGEHRRG